MFHLAALTVSHDNSSCAVVTPLGLHLAVLSTNCTLLWVPSNLQESNTLALNTSLVVLTDKTISLI